MRPWHLAVIALFICGGTLSAQPPAAQSTGQEGQLLPGTFNVYAVTGSRPQFMHDFFSEHGLNPAVAVIALQTPANPQDPLAVLLQKLNAIAAASKEAKLGAFTIFLTLDKGFYEDPERLRKVGELEGLHKQLTLNDLALGLSHPDAQPAKQFGIVTRDDPVNSVKKHTVTVLVYNKHKVEKRFVFTDDKKLDEAAIKDVLAAVEKMAPPKK